MAQQAQFSDTIPLTAIVGHMHPKLREWIGSNKIKSVEHVMVERDLSCRLVFVLHDGTNFEVKVPTHPRSGSFYHREVTKLDIIRGALSDDVIAKLALLI